MRIVHVTGYFVENMAYQENLLPVGQVELGHEVYILTGKNEPDFGFNTTSRYRKEEVFLYKGVTVQRLNHYFEPKNKGPVLRGVTKHLNRIQPDVVFVHGIGLAFISCLFYKLFNPSIYLQFDCHSTMSNSLNSTIGPLYHWFFKILFSVSKSKFDRIFAVSPESFSFLQEIYGLEESSITLLPLPGDTSLLPLSLEIRLRVRQQLGLKKTDFVLIHTGKLPGDKRTESLLRVFSNLPIENVHLLIAGSIDKEFMAVLRKFSDINRNITYLGWVSAEKLRELFIAADILVQPGSLSNTFIDAICCGLPVILDDTPQGRHITAEGNGKLVPRSDQQLAEAILECLEETELAKLKERAVFASSYFSYVNNAKITMDHLEAKHEA